MKRLLLRLLKVPPEPQTPPGSRGATRIFRAAPGYYRYVRLKWLLTQVGAIAGIVFSLSALGFAFERFDGLAPLSFVLAFEIYFLPLVVLQAIVSYALLKMRYELRWYMVSDRALRIRQGIFKIREQTMTVANIQNMAIHRGPLQRLFGIADLRVRTAGGGRSGEDGSDDSDRKDPHLGIFEGVDNAEELRDTLLAALRQLRDSGLGDPDEPASGECPRAPSPMGPGANEPRDGSATGVPAAESVLAEVRALRLELTSPE